MKNANAKGFFGYFLIFLIGISVGTALAYLINSSWFKGRPEIVGDLPREKLVMEAEVRKRLLQKAKVGAKASVLTNYLQKMGFRPTWGGDIPGFFTATFLRQSIFTCPESWWVSWKKDSQNHLQDIKVTYVDYCS